jgi:hypothetical protein
MNTPTPTPPVKGMGAGIRIETVCGTPSPTSFPLAGKDTDGGRASAISPTPTFQHGQHTGTTDTLLNGKAKHLHAFSQGRGRPDFLES